MILSVKEVDLVAIKFEGLDIEAFNKVKIQQNCLRVKELGRAKTNQTFCQKEHGGDDWDGYATETLTACNENEATKHWNCLGIKN